MFVFLFLQYHPEFQRQMVKVVCVQLSELCARYFRASAISVYRRPVGRVYAYPLHQVQTHAAVPT